MIAIRLIRENIDYVKKQIEKRFHYKVDWNRIVELDKEFLEINGTLERLQHKAKVNAKLFKRVAGDRKKIDELKQNNKQIKEQIRQIKEQAVSKKAVLKGLLMEIPNLPDETIPVGKDESTNRVVKKWGEPTVFDFKPKNHWQLAKQLGILDCDRAAELSGSRFVVHKGKGAKLERSLINFMLDIHSKQGYQEILTPVLVKAEALMSTGQLPKFIDDLYRTDDGMFLIPTAEVTLVNLHAGEIIEVSDLPIKYQEYSLCFRKEAGSYGKDVRGIIRQHQFNKVELVKFCRPEESDSELELLVKDAESVLQTLGIAYRVMELSTGDIGFSARKTYDIEVWLPSQDTYREISSCSNFEDFQARRARIRYRKAPKSKPEYLHTLNGSGLAVGRLMVALLENYQEEDGSVTIPDALRPYVDEVEKITYNK